MRRREFITLIGGAAVAWPLAAHGQRDKIPRIGFIGASLEQAFMAAQYGSFLAELREQGFEEGRNIVVDYKRNDDPRGPFAAAAELIGHRPI
jgi:putative tryptophan/tyrosine transport system substrate-binding protein